MATAWTTRLRGDARPRRESSQRLRPDHESHSYIAPNHTPTPLDMVALEISRARRHQRPFTLVHIPRSARSDGMASTRELANSVRPTLRSTDHLWSELRGVLMLLPETDGSGADELVGRLTEMELLSDGRAPRRASFPQDGVTSGALFAVLEGDTAGLPAPDEIPALDRRELADA